MGTITNNVRVQPSRAAKQAFLKAAGPKSDGNAFVHSGKSNFVAPVSNQQGFHIHIDSEPELQNTQSNGGNLSSFGHCAASALNPAVTSFSRAPLTNVFVANASRREEGKSCGTAYQLRSNKSINPSVTSTGSSS